MTKNVSIGKIAGFSFEKIFLDYDDKVGKIILESQVLPLLLSDSFCKPTLKHLHNNVLFAEEGSLLIHIPDFFGWRSRMNHRFWLETDDFYNSTVENSEKKLKAPFQPYFFTLTYHGELLLQIYQDWKVSHKKIFSVENQLQWTQLSNLIYLSYFVKVLIWTLETKTQLLPKKAHLSVNSQCLQH